MLKNQEVKRGAITTIEQAAQSIHSDYRQLGQNATIITNQWWLDRKDGQLDVDYRLGGIIRYPIFENVMLTREDILAIYPFWDAWNSGKVKGRITMNQNDDGSIKLLQPGYGNVATQGYVVNQSSIMEMGYDRTEPRSTFQGCSPARFYLNENKLTEMPQITQAFQEILEIIDSVTSNS